MQNFLCHYIFCIIMIKRATARLSDEADESLEKSNVKIYLCTDPKGLQMKKTSLPSNENIYETDCPILFAMEIIGQKWKLPILWYIADKEVIRYNELQRKVVGITATMLTKDLRELENDGLISRKQYSTIPPTVEYSLTEKGKTLIPALDTLYQWADDQTKAK